MAVEVIMTLEQQVRGKLSHIHAMREKTITVPQIYNFLKDIQQKYSMLNINCLKKLFQNEI